MNKIANTRVGDNINYFVNGVEDSGIVVKMNNAYVTVVKDGKFKDIQLNETFFVKDIILNKTWDSMDAVERIDALNKAHAGSPRYVTKTWDQLPEILKELLVKNNGTESSAKDGKDDDMNTTVRIFDEQKALSGDSNYKRTPSKNSDHASADAMSTDPKSESGGFKINSPIGTEGVDDHGKTGRTRQRGVGEREPSVEEEKGVKRGGEHDSKENKRALGESSVKLFSGYNAETGEKEYNDKSWTDALNEVRTSTDVNKILGALGAVAGGIARGVGGAVADAGKEAVESATEPDVEKSWIEKLNQVKSNVETSIHGNAGSNPNSGVSTSIKPDAPKDYEGASHSGIRLEQFKHENLKPKVKETLDLGDTKPSDTKDGGNKYDTKTQPKTIKGRIVDQEKDKKI